MTLKDYLSRHEESDEDFAERAGISRATVKRIHKTGGARSAAVIQKIVAACNNEVSLSDLVAVSIKKSRRRAA